MNKITQQLSLDLVEISHNIVYARQNDKLTRDLIITVTNNGYPYSIPSGAFVYLRGTRADGKSVFYQVAINDHEAGIIHADIHDYVISSAGRCKLDIGIYKRIQERTENDADEIASTEPFILYVPKEIFDENKVVNSDEGSTLAKLINESRDKIADMNSLEAEVTGNEMVRKTNEANRVIAESNRVTNENTRKTNEVKRQNDTNAAIERVNDAAENANQKANDAKNAADNANSKANDLQNKLDSHYFALMEDLQSHNSSASAHDDIRRLLSSLLTRLNALADSDDTTLDQLSEIVAYIKSNRSLIDGITTSKVNVADIIDNLTSTAANKPLSAKQGKVLNDLITALTSVVNEKVDKVSGKGLSTNDYTTTEKNKLAGISSGAEVNVQSDWNVTDSSSDAFIKNKPTIPSVGNGTVTIKQGGVSKGSFTMNQSGNTTIELADNSTAYSNMTGATTSANGTSGLVPAPTAGSATRYLRSDGTWQVPPNTNTWRGIQDNLNSTSTTESLSAKQGKVLNDKFADYLPLTGGEITGTLAFKNGDTQYTIRNNSGQLEIRKKTPSLEMFMMRSSGDGLNSALKINGNASTADRLSTARTIFGKSFDGSANIGGQGLFYGTATDTASDRFAMGGLQIRENDLVGTDQADKKYAPSIGFHWEGKSGATLLMNASGAFNFLHQNGSSPAPVWGLFVSKNSIGIEDTEGRIYYPMTCYGDGVGYGTQLVIGGGGNTFIGAGEACGNLYNAFQTASNLGANETYSKSGETMFIASDGHVYFYSNANTVANRIGFRLNQNGALEPVGNNGSNVTIGTKDNKFSKGYFTEINFGSLNTLNSNGYCHLTSPDGARIICTDNGTGNSAGITPLTLVAEPLILRMDTKSVLLKTEGDIQPYNHNKYNLGSSSVRWKEIWCASALNTSSDKNLKKDIKDLADDERYIEFFTLLQPKSYLFKDGESGRTHVGFIAQDVEDAMTKCGLSSLEFAGFCKDQKKKRVPKTKTIVHPANEETGEEEWVEEKEIDFEEELVFDADGNPIYEYSLRYEEFIALNTMMIQNLCKRNQEIENRLLKLEEKVF